MAKEVGSVRIPGGLTVEWEIEDYFNQEVEVLRSPIFPFSDATWEIVVHPNGHPVNKTVGTTCLYLARRSSKSEKHHINFKIGIKKADGAVYHSSDENCTFDPSSTGRRPDEGLRSAKLLESKNVLAPDNILRIFCILRLSDDTVVEAASQTSFSECGNLETLSENLRELCVSGCHSDVTIKVKDQEFQAHRSIMSARSAVFSSMFQHDMTENRNGVIEVTDCDPDSFRNVLLFVYTGKVDAANCNDVFGLYKTADKYDLQQLKTDCTERMIHEISIESFCDITLIAVMHNESDLLNTATEFFIKNWRAIFPSIEWQRFLKNHTAIASELLIKLSSSK